MSQDHPRISPSSRVWIVMVPRWGVEFDGDPALSDQVEAIGFLIRPENRLPFLEQDVRGTADNQLQVLRVQTPKEGVLGEDGFEGRWHLCSPGSV